MSQYLSDRTKLIKAIVAYDISDDKRRSKLVKILSGYGVRQQNSVFSVRISPKQFKYMKQEIRGFAREKDKIMLVRVINDEDVTAYGSDMKPFGEDCIIL